MPARVDLQVDRFDSTVTSGVHVFLVEVSMLRKLLRLAIAVGVIAVAMIAPASSISAASPNLFATVAANGTLVNGNGVSSVSHTVVGQYEVTFTANVSSCAYEATTQNTGTQALQVFTAGGHLSANGVYVEVK